MRFMTAGKAGTFGISGLALLAMEAGAQQMEETFRLPDITLPGIEQSVQRAAQIKRDARNAMEVIDSEQLSQFNEQALGDALRRLPGVTFDGANRTREIRLLGLPGEYTQVLINGRLLLDGESRRNFEMDRIPTSLVDRVEIIRSPRAGLDGAGAAGTLNIVLKNGADLPTGTQIRLGAGYLEDTGELGELTFLHHGQTGALSYRLAGSVQQFQRNESTTEISFDGLGAPTDKERRLSERRFEQINLTPGFTWDLGAGGALSFDPYYFYTKEFRDGTRTNFAGDLTTREGSRVEKRERTRIAYGIRAGWEVDLSSAARLSLGVDWQKGKTDTRRDEQRRDAGGTVTRVEKRTERIDLELIRPEAILSWQAGAHDLSLGFGAVLREHAETNSERRDGALRPPRQDRVFDINEDIYFAFFEDVWAATDRLTLTTGLRLERSRTKTEDFFGAKTSNKETVLLPSLNMVYQLSSASDLRLGLARTLRRPDLRSLTPTLERRDGTAADPDRRGNPDQSPESIWGLNLGIDHYFAEDRGFVSLNAFGRRFDDKIEAVTGFDAATGRFVSTPRNVGDAHAYGLELSGRMPLDDLGLADAALWGSALYTKSKVDDPLGGSRPFLDQPDFVGTIGLDYEYRPWNTTFGLALNWTSSINQRQNLAGGGTLRQSISSRARLDLTTRTEIADNTFLTISATNLLGQTEGRVDRVFDAAGTLQSRDRRSEPTYRNYFIGITRAF